MNEKYSSYLTGNLFSTNLYTDWIIQNDLYKSLLLYLKQTLKIANKHSCTEIPFITMLHKKCSTKRYYYLFIKISKTH